MYNFRSPHDFPKKVFRMYLGGAPQAYNMVIKCDKRDKAKML